MRWKCDKSVFVLEVVQSCYRLTISCSNFCLRVLMLRFVWDWVSKLQVSNNQSGICRWMVDNRKFFLFPFIESGCMECCRGLLLCQGDSLPLSPYLQPIANRLQICWFFLWSKRPRTEIGRSHPDIVEVRQVRQTQQLWTEQSTTARAHSRMQLSTCLCLSSLR